ncbi:MAG: DUF5312 domain-containing protein [Treponema sp.]|nr:DUF5312 domain-containing protein [Treponema sp.]
MVKSGPQNNSFDELVAGISADERRFLLEKLKRSGTEMPLQGMEMPQEDVPDDCSIQIRIKSESLLYRIILWLRSVFTRQTQDEIYNDDLIVNLVHKVTKAHPGLVDYQHRLFQSLFYEKLKELKECADFFKPYMTAVNDNAGEFYAFLSTFIAPEIGDAVGREADPYSIPFDRSLTNELRTSLIRKLEIAVRDISPSSKQTMYSTIRSIEWLRQLTGLPYLHFIAQFTAIISESYTCPFSNALTDFQAFARVLSNCMPVSNEALEALFLFPQRKAASTLELDSDNEKALRDFLKRSVSAFSMIQMFIRTVPVCTIGRIIFNDYNWQPEPFGGAEDWSVKFREEWKKVFDERWEAWLRDRKKNQLSVVLSSNFGLKEFPVLPFRPWADLWGGVPFHCEMTAGFLSWFNSNEYSGVMAVLNVVMLEGVFLNEENRTEFSEAVNDFSVTNQRIESFVESLSPRGNIGTAFEKVASEHIRSLKGQSRIDSLILNAETNIHEIDISFCKQCRIIEDIFHGILDGAKDSRYESIQNLMTIHGHENRIFRDKMEESRTIIKNARQLLADIEPLDLPRQMPADFSGLVFDEAKK